MPKYIDADALKEIFALECKDVCDGTDEFDTKWGASQELIEKVIDSAPAADVEPVNPDLPQWTLTSEHTPIIPGGS